MSSPWLQELVDGWERVLGELRSKGWTAELITTAAPVQIQGFVPTGEPFYFRARHDDLSLAIGGDARSEGALWNASENCDNASYLSGERGMVIILRMWAQYQQRG